MHFKKNLIPLLCLVVIFLINACKKSSGGGGDTGMLSVSRAAVDLDTTAGFTDTLAIHSTLPWKATLSSGASWCKLSMASGDAGDAVLTITILSNNGTATPQTATITFTPTNGQSSPDPSNVCCYNGEIPEWEPRFGKIFILWWLNT